MIKEFEPVIQGILALVAEWEPKLAELPQHKIMELKNSQNRTIKQIVGHLIDSASNNTHRIVHLQYQESPFNYPNYASNGNNDRWIAIQNYQDEDWITIVQLWKYANQHIVHVMKNINAFKLDNQWIAGEEKLIPLRNMTVDYLRHLQLHLDEIGELVQR